MLERHIAIIRNRRRKIVLRRRETEVPEVCEVEGRRRLRTLVQVFDVRRLHGLRVFSKGKAEHVVRCERVRTADPRFERGSHDVTEHAATI